MRNFFFFSFNFLIFFNFPPPHTWLTHNYNQIAIWPHPTIITWQIVRVGGKNDISEKNEEEFATNNNQESYDEYDEQDVLAEI